MNFGDKVETKNLLEKPLQGSGPRKSFHLLKEEEIQVVHTYKTFVKLTWTCLDKRPTCPATVVVLPEPLDFLLLISFVRTSNKLQTKSN